MVHTVVEHFDMIMAVHGLNPAFPEFERYYQF
jgi:urease alpha subunit